MPGRVEVKRGGIHYTQPQRRPALTDSRRLWVINRIQVYFIYNIVFAWHWFTYLIEPNLEHIPNWGFIYIIISVIVLRGIINIIY